MRDHKLLQAICLLNRAYSAEANQLYRILHVTLRLLRKGPH